LRRALAYFAEVDCYDYYVEDVYYSVVVDVSVCVPSLISRNRTEGSCSSDNVEYINDAIFRDYVSERRNPDEACKRALVL
jgi:hypothetical protein